jgi:adenosine deaminase
VTSINLHTHLEGCVRLETAVELAAATGVREPKGGWEAALVMRVPSDLTIFLAHVAAAYPLLGSYAALSRVAYEAVLDAGADGCSFCELRFGPTTHARDGFGVDEVIAAVCEGVASGAQDAGISAGVVVCALRHHDENENLAVARAAAARAGRGVVGFDVAGDELLYPDLGHFVGPFRCAAATGLGLTAHVAEAGPASNVLDAHEILGVRRIGHGTRLGSDPEVLGWAVDHGMCLEVCATSNVFTGAARSIAEHPIHRFLEAGCNVVLGDDNPITVDTRLSREVRHLSDSGLTSDDLERIERTAIEFAFCEPGVRAELRARAHSEHVRRTS